MMHREVGRKNDPVFSVDCSGWGGKKNESIRR
jgi:hypothetical protein